MGDKISEPRCAVFSAKSAGHWTACVSYILSPFLGASIGKYRKSDLIAASGWGLESGKPGEAAHAAASQVPAQTFARLYGRSRGCAF